ncbi:Dual oxidase maturation factor 1 [Portunus trituberculatus]|uniref:Dual oxidase maturation factor 1 n=1 Tax=Portunus trituberculatus TaxID=210409 RepID=A0A5B7CWN0_PORTR|nr:Dual oxidase maturation factor 1 [Portunus trituberculatus]
MYEALEDGGLAREGEDTVSPFWWWFSLNREKGGPAYHFRQNATCPFFVSYFNITVSILIFILPLVLCLVLLSSARSKKWSKLLVVLLVFGTGFLLTVVFESSWWLVGMAEVNMSVGPQKPPVQGTLEVWAGLWHLYLNYVTDDFTFNQRVDWSLREDLVAVHKKALNEGWPWALVSLAAELGDESTAWRGQLGDGLRLGGLAAASFMVAAITSWALWALLFIVSPQATGPPIMLSGTILAMCSVVYVLCVSWSMPDTLTVAGNKMTLSLGHAWWVTTGMGLCLTLVGLGLLLYDTYCPGQLATIFELEFGTPNQQLYPYSNKSPKPILAFHEEEEAYYSQGYPWPRPLVYFSDEEDTHLKETERCICKLKQQTAPDGKRNKIRDEKTELTFASSLSDGQTHTTHNPPPDTLRRRSPEQQQVLPPSSLEQNISPPTNSNEAAFTKTSTSIPDNHSTLLVERHVPKTNALLRTNSVRRSMRSFCRVKPRLSVRLSYRSALRKKSMSLSRLVLPSMAKQDCEEGNDGKSEQWVEENDESEPDFESAAWVDCATRF